MSGGSLFRSRWLVAAILAAIAVCGYLGWRAYDSAAANAAKAESARPPAPIPVTVAPVRKADFPVYLYGLGVVEPYDTVTVSSRVDGEITKIYFKQGRMVKEGEILAQIDPRPYQAALDQALAKKAQDEATLKNAQLDLKRYTILRRGLLVAPAARHATGAGRSAHRADQGGSSLDRQRPDAVELHDDPGSTVGEDQLPSDRSRQHRPCERQHGHRDDRQAAADFCGIHGARAGRAGAQQRARRRDCARRRVEFGRADDALPWPSRPRQQRGGSGERRHPHEGDVREHRQRSLARTVGLHATAARHAPRRRRRACGCGAARTDGPLRLCRGKGRQGGDARYQGFPRGRADVGRHTGSVAR